MLQDLPLNERNLIQTLGIRHPLLRGALLADRGERLTHVYFPQTGAVAIQAKSSHGTGLQLSLADRRSVVGETCILGNAASPYRLQVVEAGEAIALSTAQFVLLLPRMPELERRLRRAILERIATLTEAALAHASQTIPTRLAHLLNARFAGCNEISVTHRELSSQLAVRRAGVTAALHVLEGRRAIRSRRGRILLLDRTALVSTFGT